MAKTEVILTQNVVGLGAESDQIKVAAGYARNYLFPHKLAIPLTAANQKRLTALRKRRDEREKKELDAMKEVAASVDKIILRILVKTGADGRMFGAVTAGTIADELKHQCDLALDKKKIHLEQPIRALGDHEVQLHLHPTVASVLKVKVESTTPAEVPAVPSAPVQAPAPAEEKPGRPPREGRGISAREGRPARPGAPRRERPKPPARDEPKPARQS
jgi:large subunit ribosomal protein L9